MVIQSVQVENVAVIFCILCVMAAHLYPAFLTFLFSLSAYGLCGCSAPEFILSALYKLFAFLFNFLTFFLYASLFTYFSENRPIPFPGRMLCSFCVVAYFLPYTFSILPANFSIL